MGWTRRLCFSGIPSSRRIEQVKFVGARALGQPIEMLGHIRVAFDACGPHVQQFEQPQLDPLRLEPIVAAPFADIVGPNRVHPVIVTG